MGESRLDNFVRSALELAGIGVERIGKPERLSHLPSVCAHCKQETKQLFERCRADRQALTDGDRRYCPRGHTLLGHREQLALILPETVAASYQAARLGRGRHRDQLSRFLERLEELIEEDDRLHGDAPPSEDDDIESCEHAGSHLSVVCPQHGYACFNPAAYRDQAANERARLKLLSSPVDRFAPHLETVSPQQHPHLVGAVRSLIAAVDAKDSYTRGHSERVQIASCALGEALGVDRVTADHLYWASLLHDVGKIGSPDHILKKPGKLSNDEYLVMQQHPVLGDDLLKPLDWLSEARHGVRFHHERIDGAGYPDRLAGDDIPKVARIIAVADTFDAVVSRRHYRNERDARQALDVLVEAAGTQLDLEIVSAFEDAFPYIYDCLSEAPVPAEGLAIEVRRAA